MLAFIDPSVITPVSRAGNRMRWQPLLALLALGILGGGTASAQAPLNEVAGVWNPTPNTAEGFGVDVAIDGDLAIVGAWQEDTDGSNTNLLPNAGAAYIYARVNGQWTMVQKLVPNDRHKDQRFGYFVAISGGHTALIGATSGKTNGVPNAGAAYFFVRDPAAGWVQAQKVQAPVLHIGANFGTAVALDAAGDQAVIGAWREPANTPTSAGMPAKQSGAAYVYRRQTFTSWQLVQRLEPFDAAVQQGGHFGASVAIRDDHIMVGAPGTSVDSSGPTLPGAGAVYHYVNAPAAWTFSQKIVAADRAANQGFGRALAFNRDVLVVGSPTNTTDATGGGTALTNAGAAYLFQPTAPGSTGWTQTQKLVIPSPHRTAGDLFGFSVAIDRNATHLLVGAPNERHDANEAGTPIVNAGSAYFYQLSGGPPWTATQMQKLVASDRSYQASFGYKVGLTMDPASNTPAALLGAYKKIVMANPPAVPVTMPTVGKVYFFQ